MNLEDLIKAELSKAESKYPYFHSAHEAWAVLFEEIEELREKTLEVSELTKNLFYEKVRSNYNGSEMVKEIRAAAENAAKEAIQIAAVCDRFLKVWK